MLFKVRIFDVIGQPGLQKQPISTSITALAERKRNREQDEQLEVEHISGSHLTQQGESVFVLGRTAATSRILEVEVESVEVVLSEKGDGRRDELCTGLGSGQHLDHLVDPGVPAAYGQRHLQLRVGLLQVNHSLVPTTGSVGYVSIVCSHIVLQGIHPTTSHLEVGNYYADKLLFSNCFQEF